MAVGPLVIYMIDGLFINMPFQRTHSTTTSQVVASNNLNDVVNNKFVAFRFKVLVSGCLVLRLKRGLLAFQRFSFRHKGEKGVDPPTGPFLRTYFLVTLQTFFCSIILQS